MWSSHVGIVKVFLKTCWKFHLLSLNGFRDMNFFALICKVLLLSLKCLARELLADNLEPGNVCDKNAFLHDATYTLNIHHRITLMNLTGFMSWRSLIGRISGALLLSFFVFLESVRSVGHFPTLIIEKIAWRMAWICPHQLYLCTETWVEKGSSMLPLSHLQHSLFLCMCMF